GAGPAGGGRVSPRRDARIVFGESLPSGGRRDPRAGAGRGSRRCPRISRQPAGGRVSGNFLIPRMSSPGRFTELKRILPRGEISLEKSVLEAHAGDKWFASHLPDAVALPRSTSSVAALLRFASRHQIPVTPRGAGYGYVGGCVPMRGGI